MSFDTFVYELYNVREQETAESLLDTSFKSSWTNSWRRNAK